MTNRFELELQVYEARVELDYHRALRGDAGYNSCRWTASMPFTGDDGIKIYEAYRLDVEVVLVFRSFKGRARIAEIRHDSYRGLSVLHVTWHGVGPLVWKEDRE